MRILIVAHGHPDISTGGAEIAARRQCDELRRRGHVVQFMARAPGTGAHCGTPFSTLRGGDGVEDVLFHSPNYDHFLHSQRAKWAVYNHFRGLLERFRPDVVHFHHFVFLGLEMIREARHHDAAMPVLLTLHEYLAICHHHGQMVTVDGRLCHRATPAACNACYPEHAPQQFHLREVFIRSFLNVADGLICPSHFLLERYAAWGLPREKLRHIANGEIPRSDAAVPPPSDRHCRVAFFGQISGLKGVFVFLDAIRALPRATRDRMVFEIYGTAQHQDDDLKARLDDAITGLGGDVRFYGPYRQADLAALMGRVGWVVVPSVWWENAPLVIQEAFSHGCPVICSNIGGMAEHVTHGVDGLHFIAGNAGDLALRFAEAGDAALHARLQAGIKAPVGIAQSVDAQLALYEEVARQRGGVWTSGRSRPINQRPAGA